MEARVGRKGCTCDIKVLGLRKKYSILCVLGIPSFGSDELVITPVKISCSHRWSICVRSNGFAIEFEGTHETLHFSYMVLACHVHHNTHLASKACYGYEYAGIGNSLLCNVGHAWNYSPSIRGFFCTGCWLYIRACGLRYAKIPFISKIFFRALGACFAWKYKDLAEGCGPRSSLELRLYDNYDGRVIEWEFYLVEISGNRMIGYMNRFGSEYRYEFRRY